MAGITVSPLPLLWLCLSCVRKTSNNTEDLMFGLIAGQLLNMNQNGKLRCFVQVGW
jgi:hypothetical protein